MKTFNRLMTRFALSDTAEPGAGQFEDLATIVLVGFLSLVTLIVLL